MVRKRQMMEGKIKSLTSEGRMQAIVLMVLPVAAFIAIWVISPTYIATLLARPWLIVATLAAQGLGALWIRKIVQIDF
jgi:tight adherence protein B